MFNLLKTRESREASKFVLTKYQVKFNPKTKNIQTETSSTKVVVGMC
jgi:hypothetical protein